MKLGLVFPLTLVACHLSGSLDFQSTPVDAGPTPVSREAVPEAVPEAAPPSGTSCPTTGEGGDPDLNNLKNKTISPSMVETFKIPDILAWEVPDGVGRKPMAHWTFDQRSAIFVHESLGVQVVGYLRGVRQEGPEATNCDQDSPAWEDFHMWLVASPSDPKSRAVVVEVTPRVRASHPTWTVTALSRVARERTPVRITGWSMFDPDHPEQLGKSRGTLWEVHPITKIEVQGASGWTQL